MLFLVFLFSVAAVFLVCRLDEGVQNHEGEKFGNDFEFRILLQSYYHKF